MMSTEFQAELPLKAATSASSGAENEAFVLALLTAGGGLTGYIRTGSVPSVAAGMTVGALVRSGTPSNLSTEACKNTSPSYISTTYHKYY